MGVAAAATVAGMANQSDELASSIPTLTSHVRDVSALFGAFTTLKEVGKEAKTLAKSASKLDETDVKHAVELLRTTHDHWVGKLQHEILTEDAAAKFTAAVPSLAAGAGAWTLATACTVGIAFLQSVIDAPGFMVAAKAQELNARRAERDILDELDQIDDEPTGQQPQGTYL